MGGISSLITGFSYRPEDYVLCPSCGVESRVTDIVQFELKYLDGSVNTTGKMCPVCSQTLPELTVESDHGRSEQA